ISPNHHALAKRFGLNDRFFVNAEVSPQGHNCSTAAYSADYVEKTVDSNYSDRGRTDDYQGTNRGQLVDDDDDVNSPSTGYLWDLAVRKKISLRNYGNFVAAGKDIGMDSKRYYPTKTALMDTTATQFPDFDMDIPD